MPEETPHPQDRRSEGEQHLYRRLRERNERRQREQTRRLQQPRDERADHPLPRSVRHSSR